MAWETLTQFMTFLAISAVSQQIPHSVLAATDDAEDRKGYLNDNPEQHPNFPAMDSLGIRNELGDLLFYVYDNYEEEHTRHHRVRKVLQPPSYEKLGIPAGKTVISIPRRRRYVFPDSESKRFSEEFKYSSLKYIPGFPPTANIANISSIELKFFQSEILSLFKTICPKLSRKHVIMLKTVEKSALNQIRSASINRKLSKSVGRDDRLLLLMQKIKKCGKAFVLKGKRGKMAYLKRIKKKNGRFSIFRKRLERESKQKAMMSQKDVIPTDESVARLYELIQNLLLTSCLDEALEKEARKMGNYLTTVIRMRQQKRYGEFPTVHQIEMENLVNDAKRCILNFAK